MSNHPHRSKHTPHPLGRSPKPAELTAVRDQAGLTQTQAANLVGVTLTAWQRWEQPVGDDSHRDMSPALFDLFKRRLREMPGAKYGLGTPTDPIDHWDPVSGMSVNVGFGWKLADAAVGETRVQMIMAPSGATRASVQVYKKNSAEGTGRWFETPESAIAWLRREHWGPATANAIKEAEQRHPRLRDFNGDLIGRKNWAVTLQERGELCAALFYINGEPRLTGIGTTHSEAVLDLLEVATVMTEGLGDDDRRVLFEYILSHR
jgi:hypothetical protein